MSKNNTASIEKISQWFHDGKYGVMMHFLGDYRESDEAWNKRVDAFDTDALAAQLHEIGAGHLLFTISQCGGRFCLPLATYDLILEQNGFGHSLCSKRDLIADLIRSLDRYGIRLMLYAAAEGPVAGDLKKIFPWNSDPTTGEVPGPKGNHTLYWHSMLREISLRYGKKVCGWWIDGCYGIYPEFSDLKHPYSIALIDALQAGNPDSLTALNCGIDIRRVSEAQEYTCGEMNRYERTPESRFIDGMQWHVLTYLGPWWSDRCCAHSTRELVNYVRTCTDKGGVVTLDVAYLENGTIVPEHLEQLKQVRRFVKEKESFTDDEIPESADYLAHMSELEMPEIPADFVNIAPGKKATATSMFNEGYSPDKAVDGDLTTGWAPGITNPGELYWQLDLGEATDVAGVEYFTRGVNSCERRNFELRGSLDPEFKTWEVLLHQDDFPLPDGRHWSAVYDAPIRCRYVRLVPNGRFSIPFASEVRVFVRQ